MSVSREEWEKWFQDVWALREDVIYKRLFGATSTKVFTIPRQLFERMGFPEVDERWLTHGVIVCEPTETRSHWSYITTALSNPWGISPDQAKPTEPSGLGFELLMETPQESPWAVGVLQWLMAVNILAATGQLQGETVFNGVRVPLQGGIDPKQPECSIRNLLITEASHLTPRFTLPSGTVDLLLCIGITDKEMEFIRDEDQNKLLGPLKAAGIFPFTVADRESVIL